MIFYEDMCLSAMQLVSLRVIGDTRVNYFKNGCPIQTDIRPSTHKISIDKQYGNFHFRIKIDLETGPVALTVAELLDDGHPFNVIFRDGNGKIDIEINVYIQPLPRIEAVL